MYDDSDLDGCLYALLYGVGLIALIILPFWIMGEIGLYLSGGL